MPEQMSVRMDRVERIIEILAEKQVKLDDVVTLLVEAQIKTEERFRETGERIDKLVSAIGEMLRTRNGGTH